MSEASECFRKHSWQIHVPGITFQRKIMLIFSEVLKPSVLVYGVGFTWVTAAQGHVCICPAATGLKPYYLNSQSCVIYGKHKTKAKKLNIYKCRAGTSACKRALDLNYRCVSNSGSPLSFIMCKAHFHIEIRLHFKSGGAGGLSLTRCICKKGNCISLIEELLRLVKASALSVQAGFCASVLLVLLHSAVFWSTDYMSPSPKHQKKVLAPDIHGPGPASILAPEFLCTG